jgi:hypothetical protein
MNIPDYCGLRQAQQVIISLQIRRPFGEPFTAIISLFQLMSLDHGAHGTVQKEDALAQKSGKIFHMFQLNRVNHASVACSLTFACMPFSLTTGLDGVILVVPTVCHDRGALITLYIVFFGWPDPRCSTIITLFDF